MKRIIKQTFDGNHIDPRLPYNYRYTADLCMALRDVAGALRLRHGRSWRTPVVFVYYVQGWPLWERLAHGARLTRYLFDILDDNTVVIFKRRPRKWNK